MASYSPINERNVILLFYKKIHVVFMLIPYLQKLAIAIILVIFDDPIYQVCLFVFFRFYPYLFTYQNVPFFYFQLFIKVLFHINDKLGIGLRRAFVHTIRSFFCIH